MRYSLSPTIGRIGFTCLAIMMFTLDQITHAHARVKSGADFPAYIQDLKKLGVLNYETYVVDGHSEYFGAQDFKISSPTKYAPLIISIVNLKEKFLERLKAHQQGKTDYATFCHDAAEAGVEKWTVDLIGMTCTYYDKAGSVFVVERVPG
jgi:uncharacterized protein YbcV (DUF1398 family)